MDPEETGPRAVEMLLEYECATESEIEGCTDAEIRHVERTCGVDLPVAYESMLKHMGKRCGSFMQGHEFEYRSVRDLVDRQPEAIRISESEQMNFEESHFVFMSSQTVIFLYFNTDIDDPDPPVYVYSEGGPCGEQVAESFSTWLFEDIKRQCSLLAEISE